MPAPPRGPAGAAGRSSAAGAAASAALPASVPDHRLGLSPDDLATLRQHQALAHAQAQAQARSAASAASASASAAGSSAASSAGTGRLLLDAGSLAMLSRHFDRVMGAIGQRLEQLNEATRLATETQGEGTGQAVQRAEAEIGRFRALLGQIDELEREFEKIRRIGEMVRSWRGRVEEMEKRLR